jgi:leucyl-tRNA---protein transferase
MRSLFTFTAPTRQCSYLPDRDATLEYELVATMTPGEYLQRMLDGWRRFGHMMFHTTCGACRECRPLRVDAARFRPDRSQRRARKANEDVQLRIGQPAVTREKLDLYDRYHAFQEDEKGWPAHTPKEADEYAESFVNHPFPVEEWCYYLRGRLIGVGYVDAIADVPPDLKGHEGLSAIYFFWEPEERSRGLGTFNVLSAIDEARRRGLPWVYMGYYVAGCPSMEYKPRFAPNELRGDDGTWRPYRG